MSKVIVATAQTRVSNSVKQNGSEIRKLIRRGHLKGADVIHFCEGALSGYSKTQLIHYRNIDFQQIRKELEKIQALCSELNVWVVVGCAHELSDGNRPHNSMYVISDLGEIVTRYDKRKCSHSELTNWYSPGFEQCTFEILGVKFGCALCIEIHFSELFMEAEKDGVHCVLFSSYSKDDMFGIQAQGHAASNNFWISMAIPANESSILPSQFISPDGRVQSKCRRDKNSIVINVIDTESKEWHIPLQLARHWRRNAREGKIYTDIRLTDKRSESKTII